MAMFRRSISWSSASTTGGSNSRKFLPLPEQIRLVMGSSKSLDRQLDFTMVTYIDNNYMTKAEVDRISRYDNVLGLPTRNGTFQPGYPNLDQHLMQDHHDLSVFLVYILHAKEQQSEFGEHDLKEHFKEVKLSLSCVRDHIESVLTQRRVPIKHRVDSSVIPRGLKNFKAPKLRYWRDFLILTETSLFVKEVCTSYETLFHHML